MALKRLYKQGGILTLTRGYFKAAKNCRSTTLILQLAAYVSFRNAETNEWQWAASWKTPSSASHTTNESPENVSRRQDAENMGVAKPANRPVPTSASNLP